MRGTRELYALERGREKNVGENISPELPSLTTGGNFERRAKLRGLRSQEELLSAQHICKSVHSLKCLSRGFWHLWLSREHRLAGTCSQGGQTPVVTRI